MDESEDGAGDSLDFLFDRDNLDDCTENTGDEEDEGGDLAEIDSLFGAEDSPEEEQEGDKNQIQNKCIWRAAAEIDSLFADTDAAQGTGGTTDDESGGRNMVNIGDLFLTLARGKR